MKTSKPVKIQIIIGSTRQNRFSDKPARWIYEEIRKRKGISAELLDLRAYPLPFFDEPMSPMRLKGKYSNETARKWAKKVVEGDGYVIVTPEYNHGYPAVLKNALDYVYQEWNRKPVGFVSYGSVGGARAVEQLRQVVVELQMVPIQSSIHLPFSVYLAVINPKKDDQANPFAPLQDHAASFLDQLTWWAKALKTVRKND